MKKLGYFLGLYMMREHLSTEKIELFDDYHIIAPVPLFHSKYRERGYNQSQYISNGINEILKKNYVDDLIIRVKNTKTQTHLNIKEREENIKNAFEFNLKYVSQFKNTNVIIIDDVVTTGTTLNEIIKLLRKNSVKKIMCLSLAMAVNT